MKRIVRSYVIFEVIPPLILGLLAFTFILLTARILKLIEMVVSRGVPFLEIAKLFGLIVPTFLEMTLPMALLLGILLGLGRLSHDQEILAFKATGISPAQILLPIGAVAFLISLITLAITLAVRPAANLALQKELYNIAKSRVSTALKEKIFNDDFPNILIYAEEIVPPGNTCQGVLIVDRRNPQRENVIFSKVALILSDEETKSLSLKLFEGVIYERGKKGSGLSQTHFNTYDLRMNPEELFASAQKRERGPEEMSLSRLMKAIRVKRERGIRPVPELLELHQRIAFSFAPLIFGLLGVALVMVPTRTRASRSWGVAFSLCWLLVYYALLSTGRTMGEREILPPVLALWLPNVVVGLIAIHLFRKALNETPLLIQTRLEDFFSYLKRRIADHQGGAL